VPQIRRWLLASSADIAVLLKPPGVLFDLPVADATALPIGNHLSNSSSNGSSGTSSSGSNLGDRSDQTPAHAHADSKLTADEQPGSQLPPDASTGAAAPDASTACVVAQALNIRPPQQPLLVHNNLPAGSSGALVLARHAAAAAWLRAYTAGEPAALAAPVIASLGGLQAAQEAVRRSASRAAAAAASAGKKGRQGASRRREQVLQDKQLQKLQQLAALAADSRQDQRSSRQEAHRGPGVSSSSRSRSNSSSSSRVREDAAVVDPLAQFDRRELKHWLQLYGEVGGLRLRRSFWAVVQGQLKPHQSGTLRDRCVCRCC
jgi:hypothetical protein